MLLHFRGHEARKAKKAKEEQMALRRGASKVARDVRAFWGKLNKVWYRDDVVVCILRGRTFSSACVRRQKKQLLLRVYIYAAVEGSSCIARE